MKPALQNAPQGETSLTVEQFVKASPAKVYDALTKPELMSKWFICAPDCKSDIKTKLEKGGAYSIVFHKPDGGSTVVGGKYIELQPGKKVSFTWGWKNDKGQMPDDSIVTIHLREEKGGTQITLHHERLPDVQEVEQHTKGWVACLAGLAEGVNAAN